MLNVLSYECIANNVKVWVAITIRKIQDTLGFYSPHDLCENEDCLQLINHCSDRFQTPHIYLPTSPLQTDEVAMFTLRSISLYGTPDMTTGP